jgi:hypothetical protein
LKQISGNGRYVLFVSYATDLVAQPDLNSNRDIFVRDLVAGTTLVVTVRPDGTISNGLGSPVILDAYISTDGRFVTFTDDLDDLVPNDHNHRNDVFQRDLLTGITSIVSVNFMGISTGSDGIFFDFTVSPNGRHVAFLSTSSDLVPTEVTSPGGDCFVRDMSAGITRNVSTEF